MNLHNAPGAFVTLAELSQSPEIQKLAHALANAFQALANDLQLIDRHMDDIERDMAEVKRKVNQLR